MPKLLGKVLIPDAGDVLNAVQIGADTALFRFFTDQLQTEDRFIVNRPLATDIALTTRINGQNAWLMTGAGYMTWSDGLGGASDTTLYRVAADNLRTDNNFVVIKSLGVGTVINSNERLAVRATVADVPATNYGVRSLLSHTHAAASVSGLYATSSETTVAGTGGDTGIIASQMAQTIYNASGVGGNVNGALFYCQNGPSGGGLSTARGFYARVDNNHATNVITQALGIAIAGNIGVGPITSNYGMQIGAMAAVTNAYGLQVIEPSAGTNRRAIDLPSTSGLASGGITFGNDVQFYRRAALAMAMNDRFIIDRALASDLAFSSQVASVNRFTTNADGAHWWYDAAGAADTNLYRVGPDWLGSDDRISSSRALATDATFLARLAGLNQWYVRADGMMHWVDSTGTVADTNLYRSAADTLKTDDNLVVGGPALTILDGVCSVRRAAAGNQVFDAKLTADTWPRLSASVEANGGSLSFGPGGTTLPDVNLYRKSADLLKTDDALEVGGKIDNVTNPTAAQDAATKAYVDSKPGGLVGAPIPWLVPTIPSGYREFDGSAIVQATHPQLYALYGATIPDLRGKFLFGADGTRTAGATGGAETHLLTGAQSGVKAHGHTASEAAHAHSILGGRGFIFTGNGWAAPGAGAVMSNNTSTIWTDTATPTITVTDAPAADAASAHNNMPPYVATRWITIAG